MLFMNEMEIDEAVRRHRNHPILSKATCFLARFRDEVNANSDGWPYWSQPVRSAAKLMTLIQDAEAAQRRSYPTPPAVTDDQLRAAITPIKAFYTRRGNSAGMKFPEGII